MKSQFYILWSSLLGFVVLSALPGCKSFEEINTNRHGVTIEMAARDGVAIGGQIQALQQNVIPVGTSADGTDIINEYQVAYNLGPDTWSGYFAQNGDWNGGNNFTTFFMHPGWLSQPFYNSYTKAFSPWFAIKNHPTTKDHPENYALAQILKVATWHKATDYYGPIPYTKAGQGLLTTPYDSQETVYKAMLSDLEEAIEVLSGFLTNGGTLLLPNYDLVYQGKVENWIKYANSLMLRLSMRVRYADETLARTYAEKAVNHPIGVMTQKDDHAKIDRAQGLNFVNNIPTLAGQYKETRMGVPMYSYLVGYEDPRLPVYFEASDHPNAFEVGFIGDHYLPFPIGWGMSFKPEGEDVSLEFSSKPNIKNDTPTYWLRTSEVLFLRAEGALLGWSMGDDAEALYRQGVAMSFEENGISTSLVESYLSKDKTPIEVNMNSIFPVNHSFDMKSNATTSFTGSIEEKLEKIITQKWLALYPNGMEAWTEWRRTGYPYIAPPVRNTSNGVVSDTGQVRRMIYPINNARTQEEQKIYDEALQLLGGEDTAATSLWWDKK